MKLHQRNDRINLHDQGMSSASAFVIGKYLIAENADLQKLDLSSNQLQHNFTQIVQGIQKNNRIISLTMKNNQLSGADHFEDLKALVKNHPSLTLIDFSNSETNINKNKLKNIGVQALVEGILETEGGSVISEINLSYNYLT